MDLSLTPRAAGEVLNRWAHIYLQKLFLGLAPTPLQGAKLFWGFLISATLILVYVSGKLIRKESNHFNGLVAALFLGGSALISKYSGDPLSDYTAMFFVALGVLVYLAYFRINPRYQWLILILFGYIFFTATKSKESGFVLGILFFGFGFSQKQFRIKTFLKNLVYLLIGISLAFATLVLLDFVFIKNASASFAPKALSQYSSFVFKSTSLESGVSDRLLLVFGHLFTSVSQYGLPWIERIFAKLPLFGSLYLVTFVILVNDLVTERKRKWEELFVWLMPIAFLALLILGAVAAKDRHFFPMHPILAILAAQFFNARTTMNFRRPAGKILAVIKQPRVIASLLVLAIYAVYKFSIGSKFQTIYSGLVVSAAEITIILMAIWIRNWNPVRSTSAFLLVGAFSFYGIVFSNVYPLASGQRIAEGVARFNPLAEIADTFQYSPDTRIYVSANVTSDYYLLGRSTVFDVYFDCYLFNNQFASVSAPNLPEDLMVDKPYTFAYITTKEFKGLTPEEQSQLMAIYSLKYIEDGKIVILSN